MKVTDKKASLKRRYYASLLVFLLSLGLIPVSLASSGVSAETSQKAVEDAAEPTENAAVRLFESVAQTEIIRLEPTVVAEPEATEAVEAPQVEESVSEEASAEPVAYTEVAYTEPVVTTVESVYTEPVYTEPEVAYVEPTPVYDQIDIAGRVIPIFYSNNTLTDSGSQVGLYGKYFLYGHNTDNVFGGLSSLGVGARFKVTLGGETKTYQVAGSDLQTKSYFEGRTIHTEYRTGYVVKIDMGVMKAITAYGEYRGKYYDYILMTCAGTSYGNGDASHRLVLLANEI